MPGMLTSRGKYGVRAILHLANSPGRTVGLAEIADAQHVPLKYLQQIFGALKASGFVASRKGPGGGFSLAKAPREIGLADLLRALDGPFAHFGCPSPEGPADCGCPYPDACPLREAFDAARAAVHARLEGVTVADLVARRGEMEAELANVVDYVI